MAELPQVPNLDPNAGPDDAPLAPEPAATPAVPAVPGVATAPAEPAPVAAPAAPEPVTPAPETPEASTSPLEASSDSEGRPSLDDSVEEMLSQTTDQTLRLVHVEEGLREVSQTIADMKEEMEAGLVQIVQATAALQQQAQAQAEAQNQPARLDPAMTMRLDDIEIRTVRAAKNSSRVFLVGMVQLGLIIALLALLVALRPDSPESKPEPPPAKVSGFPEPKGGMPAPPEPPAKPRKPRRKKRR